MKYSVGAIVRLKNNDHDIIIIGYNGNSSKMPEHIFDYVGVNYPEGFSKDKQACYFNNDHIESVIFKGYGYSTAKNRSDIYEFDANGVVVGVKDQNVTPEVSTNNKYQFDNSGVVIGVNGQEQASKTTTDGKYIFDANGVVVGVNGQTESSMNQVEVEAPVTQTVQTKPFNVEPLHSIDISRL